MSDDRKTQAMPRKGDPRKGAPDGVNSQAETDATGGSDQGAPYPNPHRDKPEKERAHFADGPLSHGGQSRNSYHGTGQLGERKTRPGGNPNAGARDD